MPNTPLTDGINALTSYANSVTGEQDETLSDAVRTLADGYGQGEIVTVNFTGDGTYSAEVPCPWLPDIIYVYSSDILDGLNVTAVCYSITTADVYICFRKTKDSATFSANGRLPSQNTFPVIDWSNGVLTVRNPSTSGYIFAEGGNYTLVGIKR